jgi:hypothetical protein
VPIYTTGRNAPADGYSDLPESTRDYLNNGAPVGQRDDSLFLAACQFRDAGYCQADAEAVLVPRGVQDGFDEDYARKKIVSAYRYSPRDPAKGSCPNGSTHPGTPSTASPGPNVPPPAPRPASIRRPLPKPIPDGLRVLLDACFRPGEGVVIGQGTRNSKGDIEINGGTRLRVEGWLRRLDKKTVEQIYRVKDGLFIRINPMKGAGKCDTDVSAFRHGLVEWDLDQDGNLIPKELQYSWLLDSDLPIDAILDSGNRSIQAVIALNAPDLAEYKRRLAIVWDYFKDSNLDRKNKNPSRYCRCPGVERNLYDPLGNLIGVSRQELLAVKVGAVNWDHWEKACDGTDYTDQELVDLAKIRTARLSKKDCPFPAPMDQAAFHGIAGEIIRIIEPVSEPCPESILIQFLVSFGNIIGRAASLKQAGIHHLNEFTVLVGETSLSRKGTAWASVRNLLEAVDDIWARTRVRGGFPSGESIIHAVRDPGSIGMGKRKILDPGVADKRLLMYEPEFARFLENCSRSKCTLSSVTRDVWDSPPVLYASGKVAPEEATGAHISFIGHVTQQDLLMCLREVENKNGFSNRILWCAAKRNQKLPDPLWIEWGQSPEVAIVNRLKKIVQTFRASPNRHLTWDKPDGLNAWRRYYSDLQADHGGILGSIIARAQPHVARLAAIYAVLDHTTIIKPCHLQAAIAVWSYCERSAQWIFGQKTGNRKADLIYWALLHEGGRMHRTQIVEDVFSRHISKTDLDIAFGILLDGKLAEMTLERSTRAKKPVEWWTAIPSV